MTPALTAKTLRTLRSRWTTACELAEQISYSETACRNWLGALASSGVCRTRNRPHTVQKDGRKTSGHLPREYRLHTDFGGLS